MLINNPKNVLTAPLFPLGLIAAFFHGEKHAVIALMLGIPILLGWFFYGLFSLLLFRTKRVWVFVIVYVIFCLVLAFNVVGCKRTLEAVQGIQ